MKKVQNHPSHPSRVHHKSLKIYVQESIRQWGDNKCNPFQYGFKKLSIVPANETKKRLLKSGKDIASGSIRRKRQIYKLINTVVSPLNGVVSSIISVVLLLNTDNREIDAVKNRFGTGSVNVYR